MTLRSYETGKECPPLAPGKIRLYSMRFCPYCHRCLLVLHAKNIPHEIVNINLKYKPEWHFKLNPAGKVPILQQNDKVLCESLIVSEYLDETYGEERLLPVDPYLKAKDKMFIEAASSDILPMFKIHFNRDTRVEVWNDFKLKLRVYEDELEARCTTFLGGSKPSFVDYMVWPIISRAMGFSTVFPELKMPSSEELPRFARWIGAMKKDRACIAAMSDDETYFSEHVKRFIEGTWDENVGL